MLERKTTCLFKVLVKSCRRKINLKIPFTTAIKEFSSAYPTLAMTADDFCL